MMIEAEKLEWHTFRIKERPEGHQTLKKNKERNIPIEPQKEPTGKHTDVSPLSLILDLWPREIRITRE
jgi:hypothetical protein